MLGMVVLLGELVCWILTLVKMFQHDSAVKGVLGILCGFWAFIWGWMNADRVGHKNVMIAWTAVIIAHAILVVLYALTSPAPGALSGAAALISPLS